MDLHSLSCLLFWRLSLSGLLVFFSGFFVNEQVAVKTLQDAGYSDVKVTERAVFFLTFRGGSKSDSVRFTATAINPAGKPVETYVFAGWLFKAPTIRAKIN
jgi:hypothetical protein